jgi:hypothetical protein
MKCTKFTQLFTKECLILDYISSHFSFGRLLNQNAHDYYHNIIHIMTNIFFHVAIFFQLTTK